MENSTFTTYLHEHALTSDLLSDHERKLFKSPDLKRPIHPILSSA